MNHTVLRDPSITRLCLDDGHTCVTELGEILCANAHSAKLDDIIAAVQSLSFMAGQSPTITSVSQDYIETLLDVLTHSTHLPQDKEKESLLGLHLVALCQAAVDKGASDIHIEVYRKTTRYLIRVDGKREVLTRFADGQSALHQDRGKGVDLSSYVFSTLGNQDVNEREPANDSFDVNLQWDNKSKTFEFRAALMPLDRGIKLTLRCLTPRDKPLELSDMDLPVSYTDQLMRAVNQRGGAIVITGPMGSGKSSLIYALLDTVDSTARCIHSLEDPVEFEQAGICKTAVEPNTETKLGSGIYKDYAFYAKEQLRHDIDVAPFGELRDHAAAKEFCRKAETGGLAITTLHTNSVLGIPQTLIQQMGISPAIVAAPDLMRLFVHQKLIRKLCSHCALSYQEAIASPHTKAKAQLLSTLLPEHYQHCRVKSPQGCSACGGKGEKGRLVVMELVVLDDSDRQYIFAQDYLAWKQSLKARGWPDIRDHTLSRIKRGQVDIESASEQINDLMPIKVDQVYKNMMEEL